MTKDTDTKIRDLSSKIVELEKEIVRSKNLPANNKPEKEAKDSTEYKKFLREFINTGEENKLKARA